MATQQSIEFVNFLYTSFYGRDGDEGGVTYWADQIDAGELDASEVVESFFLADEFMSRVAPVARLYNAAFDRVFDAEGLAFWVEAYRFKLSEGASAEEALDDIAQDFINSAEFSELYGQDLSNEEFVGQLYQNILDRDGEAEGVNFWVSALEAGTSRAEVLSAFSNSQENMAASQGDIQTSLLYYGLLDRAPTDAELAAAAGEPANTTIDLILESQEYADSDAPEVPGAVDPTAPIFNLTEEEAAGADVMRLTGNQDVRIDFTDPNNQIEGLDLDGDGVIEQNGVENTIEGLASGFEIVDAYARSPRNQTDATSNFLGDISFDGTGFDGDGVNTDGNIFLGGLGVDTALGGVGNDFLAGGGVAQGRFAQNENGALIDTQTGDVVTQITQTEDRLFGGRNADFFFTELSLLDPADGDSLFIDGGSTFDDQATQDSDWLLIEASDDDEPVTIDLGDPDGNGVQEDVQTVQTNTGIGIGMVEVENVDASGNLYGFLDDLNTTIGGRAGEGNESGDENYGLGSSAQLRIIGSTSSNILIGGYDNDSIQGQDGNDLLFGGNLNELNNPNLAGITDDGRDSLYGGDGSDNIVFEMDGGIYEGGNIADQDDSLDFEDTLWLTDNTPGTASVEDITTDGVIRLDLGAGKSGGWANYSGYGGADNGGTTEAWTADQTNYADGQSFAQVQDMESVIATGLGGVDYQAAGTNNPELVFDNQQNFLGLNADLDLRGTDGSNTLYANTGDDVVEGREGNDRLSGGGGNDDFVFNLNEGDDIDVIERQVDANGDNLWDEDADGNGILGQDFGLDVDTQISNSSLQLTINSDSQPDAELGDIVTRVTSIETGVRTEGGDFTSFVLDTDAIRSAQTFDELATAINDALANLEDADLAENLSAQRVEGTNTILITDALGRELADEASEGAFFNVALPASSDVQTDMAFGEPLENVSEDRLIFASYEDRADAELVDDDAAIDAVSDSTTLGADGYAEDLVVRFTDNGNFGAEGTTLAEDQSYQIAFENLAREDFATITINGVSYTAQVGRNPDGTPVNAESQSDFLTRFAQLINSADNDTLAGSVNAAEVDTDGDNLFDSLSISQSAYNGGEAVYMDMPQVSFRNLSGGEGPSATVTETSETSIFLREFDGRNGNLDSENVLFVGDAGVNRAVLQTALEAGGALTGSDAIVVDTIADADTVANDFTLHGDDLLFGAAGNDTITGLTGDDRIFASRGLDTVDGGKDHYIVSSTGEVLVLNEFEAANRNSNSNVQDNVALLPEDQEGGTVDGYQDTLVVQQSDFGDDASFTVTLSAGLITNPTDATVLSQGVTGTIVLDGAAATNTTTFSNFEAVRTISGDNTLAGQGRDTLNVAALSDAAVATAAANTAEQLAAGVTYSMDGGLVQVSYDQDNNDNTVQAPVDFMQVDGVENVTTGAGNDTVIIDEKELNKENTINLAGEITDANSLVEEGDTVAYDFTGYTLAESLTTTVSIDTSDTASNIDTVVFAGSALDAAATDTLIDVENIELGDQVGTGGSDVLNVSTISGVAVNFGGDVDLGESVSGIDAGNAGNGVIDTDVLAASSIATSGNLDEELRTVTNLQRLEVVNGSAGNDIIIVADTMDGNADGDLTNDQYTFSLGAGSDIVDFRNETTSTVAVAVGTTAASSDTVTVANEATYTVVDGETYYGGSGVPNGIDLSGASVATTVEFSSEDEVVDYQGIPQPGTGTFLRNEVRNTADGTVYANFIDSASAWTAVLGSNQAETILLNDDGNAIKRDFNLSSGANVVNASAVTTTTNLLVESRAAVGGSFDHTFDGHSILTDADSLTVIASTDGSSDTINVSDLDEQNAAETKSTVVNLVTGVVQELSQTGTAAAQVINTINVQNFEDVIGSSVVDTITGSAGDNTLSGQDGNDTISGGAGNDTINGGGDDDVLNGDAGNDTISGGDGDDIITGGAGSDTINTGLGADELVYTEASQSTGFNQDATGTADVITGFTSGQDTVVIQVTDASALAGLAAGLLTTGDLDGDADLDDATILFDLGADAAIGGVGANADQVIDLEDIGPIVVDDISLRVAQSAGADAQDFSGAVSATAIYTAQNQSTLGQRDVFNGFDLNVDQFDFTALALETEDYDTPADGIQLDEILRIDIPVSVDNAAQANGFFAANAAQNPDAATAGDSVLFVLQNEAGTSNYRLFVDVNQDGDFNQADDMVIDITAEANGIPADLVAIQGLVTTDLFMV